MKKIVFIVLLVIFGCACSNNKEMARLFYNMMTSLAYKIKPFYYLSEFMKENCPMQHKAISEVLSKYEAKDRRLMLMTAIGSQVLYNTEIEIMLRRDF